MARARQPVYPVSVDFSDGKLQVSLKKKGKRISNAPDKNVGTKQLQHNDRKVRHWKRQLGTMLVLLIGTEEDKSKFQSIY